MKHLRITLILLVVCAAVGAYVFFYERGQVPEQPAIKRFEPAKVRRLELRAGPAQEPIVIERQKQGWRITAPVSARAEPSRVDALVEKLAWLEMRGEVKTAKKPEEYGLGKDAGVITATLEGGKKVVVHVGDKTPDKGAAYGSIDEGGKVVLVDPTLVDDLRGGIKPLRSVMMTGVNQDDVYRINIIRGPELITLEKVRGEWRLTRPVRAHADEEKLEMVLVNAATLRSYEFIEDRPKDLAKYGLLHPRLKVELYVRGRREPVVISFGNALETGGAYTKTSEEDTVFAAGKIQFDSVNRPLSDLRSKQIVTFAPQDAERVVLTGAGGSLEFRKKAGGEGKWEITAPRRLAADSGEVEDLVFFLSRVKAESFIYESAPMSAYGLEKPSYEALVWLKGASAPKRLALGNRADGTYYAVSAGEAGVAKVGAYIAERIRPDLRLYRDKTIMRFAVSRVRKFSITRGGERISLERKRGGWHMTEPVQALGDSASVDSILFALHDLTGDRIAAEEPTSLGQFGLDKPRIRVEIGLAGKRQPLTLLVGKDAPGGRVYMMLESGRTVYAKDNWVLPYLEKKVSDLRR